MFRKQLLLVRRWWCGPRKDCRASKTHPPFRALWTESYTQSTIPSVTSPSPTKGPPASVWPSRRRPRPSSGFKEPRVCADAYTPVQAPRCTPRGTAPSPKGVTSVTTPPHPPSVPWRHWIIAFVPRRTPRSTVPSSKGVMSLTPPPPPRPRLLRRRREHSLQGAEVKVE